MHSYKLVMVWLTFSSALILGRLEAQIAPPKPVFDGIKDDPTLKNLLRDAGSKHGLNADQISMLSQFPGSVALSPVQKNQQIKGLEDLLRTDAKKILARRIGTERIIGGPDFNPYNPGKNQQELGSPELVYPGILWSDNQKRDYWKSRSRPLLDPTQEFGPQEQKFVVSPPSKQGMEAKLHDNLALAWVKIAKLSRHVLRFEGLTNHGTGSGVMLDHETILTAGHVATQVGKDTRLIWPALPSKPSIPLTGVVHLDVIHGFDLAIVKIENAPAEFQNANVRVDETIDEAQLADSFIVAIGCPPSFGSITTTDLLFQRLFGPPGAVYVSPGVVRGSMNSASGEIGHDCSTDPGSSGSAIFLLPECKLIGVQVKGNDIDLNKFVLVNDTHLLP